MLPTWKATSETVMPDLLSGTAVVVVILIGCGYLGVVALPGVGGILSLSAFLYRQRGR